MSSKPYKSPAQVDEELAEFTDRILSGQQVDEADADVSEELRVLKNTVSQLNLIVKKTPPTSAMERIEQQLMIEWHKSQNLVEKEPSRWQKYLSLWKGSSPWRPAVVLVVSVFFLILLLPLIGTTLPNIQATVGWINQHQLILVILATITIIGLFWFSRHKS